MECWLRSLSRILHFCNNLSYLKVLKENNILAKTRYVSYLLKLFFCAAVTILPCLSACTKDTYPPTPRIVLPFAVQKAGTTVETEMRIVEHHDYIFSLCFTYKEGDQADRARVKKLVGNNHKDGDPGIPTPLKLKVSVIEPAGERVIVDKEVLELRLRSWGGGWFEKHIDYIKLMPGNYRVSVKSLKNVPELAGESVFLTIGFHVK
jgi:hypothetical protein